MPELPEVETVRCGLAPVLVGARLKRIELRRSNLRFPFAPDFVERLEGQRVEALERRAKYLLMRLESGETLLLHLGMSGRFLIEIPENSAGKVSNPGNFYLKQVLAVKHEHVVFHTDQQPFCCRQNASISTRRFG